MRMNIALDDRPIGSGGCFQVVVGLEIYPELRGVAKVTRQAQGCVGGDGSTFVHNFTNSRDRDAEVAGQSIYADAEREHELLAQNLARVDWRKELIVFHRSLLVVIDDLYIFGVIAAPAKANPVLVIDANAVLALAVGGQRFEP